MEKIYFKIDEQAPNSKEAAGYWMGVSHSIGDAMTYDIWTDNTRKVIQRSAVGSADPNRGGIPNLRVEFHEDIIKDDLENNEIVNPVNILDDPNVLCPKSPLSKNRRTNKHKVRWHDTQEAPLEDNGFFDAQESNEDENQNEPIENDFNRQITVDDLDQSRPLQT